MPYGNIIISAKKTRGESTTTRLRKYYEDFAGKIDLNNQVDKDDKRLRK